MIVNILPHVRSITANGDYFISTGRRLPITQKSATIDGLPQQWRLQCLVQKGNRYTFDRTDGSFETFDNKFSVDLYNEPVKWICSGYLLS